MQKLLVIIIIIIALCFLGLYVSNRQYETYGVYCTDCGKNDWLGEQDCMSCNNCGWCIDPDLNGSCQKGDSSGPDFAECRSWYYNGVCIWGPECDYQGPIYTLPFYYGYNLFRRRRPWRRRRRPWRRRMRNYRNSASAMGRYGGGKQLLRRNMGRGSGRGSGRGRGGSGRGRGGSGRGSGR